MINKTHLGDCLVLMKQIPDNSIDMVLCDLPYGTTKCKWDIIIPLNKHIYISEDKYLYEKDYILYALKNNIVNTYNDAVNLFKQNAVNGLWDEYNRIVKNNGAILLFSQTPFDKELGSSNIENLRYEWIWEKTQATGFLNAKKMPLKAHENVLVFYKSLPTYNPIKTTGHKPINKYTKKASVQNKTEVYGLVKNDISGGGETDRFPRSVQIFSSDKQKNKLNGTIHSTQKPLELCKYFIKTYTNEGDLVLDNTAGSGTTGLACIETNRNYIMMEKDEVEYNKARKRLGEI